MKRKDKTKWYYCKSHGLEQNPEYPQFKRHYCKLGIKKCNQCNVDKCKDFKYSRYKSFKRFFFLRKLWIELHIDLWKIRRDCNRNVSLSAYGVKERGTIKGEIPKKYKGSPEDIKKFETDYIDYLKTHKTTVRDDNSIKGFVKMTLYEKYLKDGIDINNVPFDWNIQNKRIKKEIII